MVAQCSPTLIVEAHVYSCSEQTFRSAPQVGVAHQHCVSISQPRSGAHLTADSLFLVASVMCTGRVLAEREARPLRERLLGRGVGGVCGKS